jgi:hypothetical protein
MGSAGFEMPSVLRDPGWTSTRFRVKMDDMLAIRNGAPDKSGFPALFSTTQKRHSIPVTARTTLFFFPSHFSRIRVGQLLAGHSLFQSRRD